MLLPYALSLIVGSAHSSVTCSWQQCQKHEANDLMGKQNEHKVNSDGVRLTFVHMKDRRESLSRDIAIIEYSKPIPNREIWQGRIILCIDSEIYSISLKARHGLRHDRLKKMSISVGRNDVLSQLILLFICLSIILNLSTNYEVLEVLTVGDGDDEVGW